MSKTYRREQCGRASIFLRLLDLEKSALHPSIKMSITISRIFWYRRSPAKLPA